MFEPVILALRRMAHVARAHRLEQKHRGTTAASPQAAAQSAPAASPKAVRRAGDRPRKRKRRR
jgi:hypothetical protein